MRRGFRLNEGLAPTRRARRAAVAACLSVGALGASAAPALAVNPDVFSDNPAAGTTLREAIDATVAAGGGDVVLSAGTYELASGGNAPEDANLSGDIDINSNPVTVRVVGQGRGVTIIDGKMDADGIFHVRDGRLVVENLTVTRGKRTLSTTCNDSENGGGFRVGGETNDNVPGPSATLTLDRVTVTQNFGCNGGGIYVAPSGPATGTPDRSSVQVVNSTIQANQAFRGGGGIATNGDVTVDASAIIGNEAKQGGGGVFVAAARGALWRGVAALTNTTLAANRAVGGGGGAVRNANFATLNFVTIGPNGARQGESPTGTGILNEAGDTTVSNSILASSVDNNCAEAAGTNILSGGNNIDLGLSCLPFNEAGPEIEGDRLNTDPRLRSVAFNPAPANDNGVQTIAFGPGSPALDGAGRFCAVLTDGRGAERFRGNGCDIGAFEEHVVTDLQVDIGDRPQRLKTGETLTYEIAAANILDQTANEVRVTTSTPEGAQFVSVSSSKGVCTGTASISCELGTLAPGESVMIVLRVIPNVAGSMINRATITSATSDINKGNDRDEANTTVDQGTGTGPPPPGGGGSKADVGLRLSKSFKRSAKRAKFRVTMDRPGRVVYKLSGRGVGTLAKGRRTFDAAGTKTVTLRFSRAARSKLRRLRPGSVLTFKATATPTEGEKDSTSIRLRVSRSGRVTTR